VTAAIARAPGLVWRLATDRVLVRRVGARGEGAALDLLGSAALVWVALDAPRDLDDLAAELARAMGSDPDLAAVAEAVDELRGRGLVVEVGG
jgi:hypothetical protein